jgi:hypothetical protein
MMHTKLVFSVADGSRFVLAVITGVVDTIGGCFGTIAKFLQFFNAIAGNDFFNHTECTILAISFSTTGGRRIIIFFIVIFNVFIGSIGIFGGYPIAFQVIQDELTFVPGSPSCARAPFDWIGFALSSLSTKEIPIRLTAHGRGYVLTKASCIEVSLVISSIGTVAMALGVRFSILQNLCRRDAASAMKTDGLTTRLGCMLTELSAKAFRTSTAHVVFRLLHTPFVIDMFIRMGQSHQTFSTIAAIQGTLGYLTALEFTVESLIVVVTNARKHGTVTGSR